MGRRLIALVVVALAVAVGVPLALARPQTPAGTDPPPDGSTPPKTAPAPSKQSPAATKPSLATKAKTRSPSVPPPPARKSAARSQSVDDSAAFPAEALPDARSQPQAFPLPAAAETEEPAASAPLPPPPPPSATEKTEPREFPPLEGESGAPPGRGSLPPAAPPPGPEPAGLDPHLERVQGPASTPSGSLPPASTPLANDPNRGPLPVAKELPGQAPGLATGDEPKGGGFVIAPDDLPLGKQALGLTVDVQSPQFLNIHQEATLKVVVRNSGQADALDVAVRDQLPDSLDFISSQPTCLQNERLLVWNLGKVAAGTEQTIQLRVKPMKVGSFDHAATVTMRAGGKSRTIVREPKLKVEQTVSPAKVLKGQPVEFKIRITNTGDGPARNVLVTATLSPGLRHESGEPNDQNMFEQTLDRLNPGEHMDLDPLVADTTMGGEQSCTVSVKSSDVVPVTNAPAGADDAKSTQVVQVVEPKLTMKVSGPETRYTDTEATYVVDVENPGSAPARKVRVKATLSLTGKPVAVSGGGHFDATSRNIVWSLPQLEPGQKRSYSFRVRMGGAGLFRVTAEARGEGALLVTGDARTDVKGIADIDFDVSERRRVVDVDDVTTFQVKITNFGTKEANHILVRARCSDNIEPANNVTDDPNAKVIYNPAQRVVVFQRIDRLGPGKEVTLALQVKALKDGLAKCTFYLMHDDLPEQESLEAMAAFRVMPSRR